MDYTEREHMIQDLFETHGYIERGNKNNKRLMKEFMTEWIESMGQAFGLPTKDINVSMHEMIAEVERLAQEEAKAFEAVSACTFPPPGELCYALLDLRREKEMATRRIGFMQKGKTLF